MKRTEQTRNRRALICAMVTGSMMLHMPIAAYADEEEPADQEQVVVTANRIPTKISEATANVTIITKQQIANGPYADLGDVLRDVNGVTVTGKGFRGTHQVVKLNGDDRVVIMIDGRKIGRPEGIADGRANVDLSTIISLANIDHIEIVKGGSSAIYGSDAVGGVINIITCQGKENKTTVDAAVGSGGERNYGLSMQGAEKDFSWYVTAAKQHRDYTEYNVLNPSLTAGSSKGDTRQWPNSEFDGRGLTVRLDKRVDDDRSWTFNFEHWNDEGGQPYSLSTAATVVASHLSNNAALTYNFARQTAVPGFVRVYTNYNNQEFYGEYRSRTRGFQYQSGWQLNNNQQLIAGTEWEKGEVLASPNGYSNKSATNAAVYLQDIYKLNDKWTITPGLRYDHHSKFGGQTTPKVNANYKIDKNTDIYVAYNRIFNAPNLDDLYYNNYYQGNPDLKPEKGYVDSMGINKRISDSTRITASYFTSKITNAIHWYPDDPNDQWGSAWRAYNITEERRHGFELDINHQFSPKYYTELGYSYVHVEQRGDNYNIVGNLANNQPNGYRIKLGYNDNRWLINISGQGVSGRDTSRYTDSSYWLWNMAVNYKIDQTAVVYLNAYNLTNREYEIIASKSAYSDFGDYPMPARYYRFGVRYSL